MLFELLTGRPAFPTRTGPMRQVLPAMLEDRRQQPPRLTPLNPAVTPAAEAIVRRCLQSDPARRYSSARELAEDITPSGPPAPATYSRTESQPGMVRTNGPFVIPELSPGPPLAVWRRRLRSPWQRGRSFTVGKSIDSLLCREAIRRVGSRPQLAVGNVVFADDLFVRADFGTQPTSPAPPWPRTVSPKIGTGSKSARSWPTCRPRRKRSGRPCRRHVRIWAEAESGPRTAPIIGSYVGEGDITAANRPRL